MTAPPPSLSSPPSVPSALFRCAAAVTPGGLARDVDIEVTAGTISAVRPADGRPPTETLGGVVVPGFADAHSHVFHRALRGRTYGDEQQAGSFWTWRQLMYRLAGDLDPDTFRDLALAAYTEMVCAGVTAVGEFHYLHHPPGGGRYADPNAMGLAAVDAGTAAGLAVTLLDVCYLTAGLAGEPLHPVQQRFSDGTVAAWAERVALLPPSVRTGVAAHSVRAVPPGDLAAVAAAAAGRPVHVHVSEQPAENEACLAATGSTPTGLLADRGLLGPATALVHATHLTEDDVQAIGAAGCSVVLCPTTEADLADGLPRAGALAAAGARLCVGGDQHVLTDPLAQARGVEWGERLATGRRGTFPAVQLLEMTTVAAHRAIGSPGGRLEVGAPADLVELDPGSARTAGTPPESLVFSATAADVRTVVAAGTVVARDGVHLRHGAPGPLLARAVERAWAR
ncbi:formimidoylglutamate deiminase [Nakamurella endophytica]|uniref:Formimidoylglutamate deiminase n=1 Tax=Nakamurella endophytica TaxID=1748367 RepID=A0A917WB08_9ACTN|nr:formimidoylglutamate deiminase [Nakamurella endophytica]GGL85734.1 formimidoylglutamate deiminase [Nakamurella endophytica]